MHQATLGDCVQLHHAFILNIQLLLNSVCIVGIIIIGDWNVLHHQYLILFVYYSAVVCCCGVNPKEPTDKTQHIEYQYPLVSSFSAFTVYYSSFYPPSSYARKDKPHLIHLGESFLYSDTVIGFDHRASGAQETKWTITSQPNGVQYFMTFIKHTLLPIRPTR